MFRIITKTGTANRYKFGVSFEGLYPNAPLADVIPAWFENGTKAITFGGTGNVNKFQKSTYATDVTAVLAATLGIGRSFPAGMGNTTVGYAIGGSNNGDRAEVDKFTYATDVRSAGTNLSVGTNGGFATGNGTIGYFSGGYFSGDNRVNCIKFTYSTGANSAQTSGNLSLARRSGTATSGPYAGWFFGGYGAADGTTTADKTLFATDTNASVASATLPGISYNNGSVGNFTNNFCFRGADNLDAASATIYKIPTATEVSSTSSGTLALAKHGFGFSCNETTAFMIAGYTTGATTNGQKMVLSTETCSTVSGLASIWSAYFLGGMG